MGDTRAINIIFAGIIIVIVIAGFYLFLTKQTIEKQTDSIKESAGTLQTDRLISEWASQSELLTKNPDAIAQSFDAWFTLRGFVVGNILGGNLQHEPQRCQEQEDTVTCNFALAKTKNKFPDVNYEQRILIPEKNRIRTIVFKGKVSYE